MQTEISFCNCKLDSSNMVLLATASMSAHDAPRCGALRSKQLNLSGLSGIHRCSGKIGEFESA